MSPLTLILGKSLYWPEGFFDPVGPLLAENSLEPWRRGGWTASLIIGLSVGEYEVWREDDVVRIFKVVRHAQTGKPKASFAFQHGTWNDHEGRVIDERSVRIYVHKEDSEENGKFQEHLVALGEVVARALDREEIILEFSRRGVVKQIAKVTP